MPQHGLRLERLVLVLIWGFCFMEEIWKDIIGYEGIYQVSSNGKVRSVDREVFEPCGKIRQHKSRLLKPTVEKVGYELVTLSKSGEIKTFRVHRLVAQAFLENLENKKEVNHKNANKSDNRIENLEWCTSLENNAHAVKNKLRKPPKNPKRLDPIKIAQFTLDGIYVRDWPSVGSVRKELGFSDTSILKCLRGQYKSSNGFIWKRL